MVEEAAVQSPDLSAARPLTGAAVLLAVLITVFWGTNPTALKIVLRGLPPIGSSGIRFGIAALGVLAWAWATRVRAWPQPGEGSWLAVNAVFFVAQIATFTLGVAWGTASHSIVILHTYPFFVVALAHFLIPGDRVTPGKLVGLVAAFSGIVALFAGDWGRWQGTQLRGDLVQLSSAVLLGAQVVYLKHAVARVDPIRVVFWQMAAGAVAFLVYGFAAEDLAAARPGLGATAAVIYQGVIIGALCFTIWMWLIRRYAASRVAIFGFIGPLVGVFLSAAMLAEPLTTHLLMSAALVAAGIIFASKW